MLRGAGVRGRRRGRLVRRPAGREPAPVTAIGATGSVVDRLGVPAVSGRRRGAARARAAPQPAAGAAAGVAGARQARPDRPAAGARGRAAAGRAGRRRAGRTAAAGAAGRPAARRRRRRPGRGRGAARPRPTPWRRRADDALVLGFAETATALGHCVAEALGGADYLHSTRRPVPGVTGPPAGSPRSTRTPPAPAAAGRPGRCCAATARSCWSTTSCPPAAPR